MSDDDENSVKEEELPSNKTIASLNKKVLTLAERIAVIYQSHAIRNVKILANMFGCGRTQIQNIIQNADSIMKEWNEDPDPYRLRRRTSEFVIGIGNLTYEWLVRKWLHEEDVNDAQILSVANELARLMDYTAFKASRRWLIRFKKKYKLTDMEEQRKKCLLQKHGKRKSLTFTSISYDIRDVLHENVKTALAESLKVNFYQALSYNQKSTDANGKVRTYTPKKPMRRNKQSDSCFTVSPKVPRTRRSNKNSNVEKSKKEPIPSTCVSQSLPSTPPPPILKSPDSSSTEAVLIKTSGPDLSAAIVSPTRSPVKQIPHIKVPPPPKSRVTTIGTQTDGMSPKPTIYGKKGILIVSEVKSLNPAAAKVTPATIQSYQDALKLLQPLEDFVLMEQNFRAIGLVETLQEVIMQNISAPSGTILN